MAVAINQAARASGANITADATWEMMWAPYDELTYQAVLANIRPDDYVLDIGAGDLHLTYRMAGASRRVHAIEIQRSILIEGLASHPGQLPENLIIRQGDALRLPFPAGITCAVLLMRHCTHFRWYVEKLKAVGCRRLITNARWRMGVEVIEIFAPRIAYADLPLGWFACWCGAAGFKPGPVELLTPETERACSEVINCPKCF